MVPIPQYDYEIVVTIANLRRRLLLRNHQSNPILSRESTESTPTTQDFERKVEEVRVSKTDMNYVIMDYLINEGYPAAAKKFAAEANMQHFPGDTESIEERVSIRNSILQGNIQAAIEKINDLDSELLDKNTPLHFSLLRLQLVELIRPTITTASSPNAPLDPNLLTPALTFASTHLGPLAPTNPQFLQDLERTMALLIFPSPSSTSNSSTADKNEPPPQLRGLLDPALRQSVAASVNEAILERKGLERQSRIRRLVRLRAWAERKAVGRGFGALGKAPGEGAAWLELWGRKEGLNAGAGDGEQEGGEDSVMAGAGAGVGPEGVAT